MPIPVMKPAVRKGGVAAAVMAAALAIAIPTVSKHEGVWLVAKPDRLAHGIPTVCFGETEGVRVGDRYTMAQCQEMLAKKLPRYADEIAPCIRVPVSAKILASYIDFAYNVGSAGFCGSSALRHLNAGDYEGACEGLKAWTDSGGQFRQGLLNRRMDEIKLCRDGIADLKAGRL